MKNKNKHHNELHEPVLLDEVLETLQPREGETYLDLTVGYGGHARTILASAQTVNQSVLVDRDANALQSVQDLVNDGAKTMHMDYYQAAQQLADNNMQFDMILMDCGVSSPHLDNASRGFSFQAKGPLDMRMDQRQELTADHLVNKLPEAELADLLYEFGEEYRSRRIARVIVAARPIHETDQLASVIAAAVPRKGKIHPATKTFQALRLAVNDEMGILAKTLPLLPKLLKSDGRMAIISFHSLEDRVVKRFMLDKSRSGWEAEIQLINKKPITAGKEELVSNPRARSAKLRGAVKINNKNERG